MYTGYLKSLMLKILKEAGREGRNILIEDLCMDLLSVKISKKPFHAEEIGLLVSSKVLKIVL